MGGTMKRPYLNQFDRLLIYHETFNGALLNIDFQVQKLKREIYKELKWITKHLKK